MMQLKSAYPAKITKFQRDAVLERLKALCDDHCESRADNIKRGDVGTLTHPASLLRRISDAAFKDGEHAA